MNENEEDDKMNENEEDERLDEISIKLLHSPVLFLDEAGNSLKFVVKPCKDKEAVREMIEHGGGEVVTLPGEYAVTLIPPDVEVTGSDEVFSVDYIKDCCIKNKLLDIKPYRMNTESRFSPTFDAMDVLLKYTTWSDALKGVPFERSLFISVRSSPSSSGSDSGFNLLGESSEQSKSSLPKFKVPVTRKIDFSHFNENETNESSKQKERSKESDFKSQKIIAPRAGTSGASNKEDQENNHDEANSENSIHKTKKQKDQKNVENSTHKKKQNAQENTKNSTHTPKRRRVCYTILNSSSDSEISDDEMWKLPKSQVPRKLGAKPARRDYVDTERKAIISYIKRHKRYDYVKGRELWQKMEAAKALQAMNKGDSTTAVEEMQQKLESLQEEMHKKDVTIQKLHILVDDAKTDYNEVVQEKAELEKIMENFECKIAEKDDELKQTEHFLEEKNQHIEELQKELYELREKYESWKKVSHNWNIMKELQTSNRHLKSELEKLEAQLASLLKLNKEKEEYALKMQSEISNLNLQMQSCEEKFDFVRSLADEMEDKSSKYKELESQNALLRSELEIKEIEVTNIQKTKDCLVKTYEHLLTQEKEESKRLEYQLQRYRQVLAMNSSEYEERCGSIQTRRPLTDLNTAQPAKIQKLDCGKKI